MMKGETLYQAMQRSYEQYHGQRTLLSFDRFQGLEEVIASAALVAGKAAMEHRFTGMGDLHPIVDGISPESVDVKAQVKVYFKTGIFDRNIYAYCGDNVTAYLAMVERFNDTFRREIKRVYPDVQVYTQTGYGSSRRYKEPGQEFTFHLTINKCAPDLPMAMAA